MIGGLTLASRRGVKGLGRWVVDGLRRIRDRADSVFALALVSAVPLLLVPMGFSMMTQMASSNTLIQVMVPDRLRGRIMGVYSIVFMGMAPLGSLLYGALADRIGAPHTLTIGGAIAICGAILFARNLPKIRVEARQLIVAQGMAGGEPAQEPGVTTVPDP